MSAATRRVLCVAGALAALWLGLSSCGNGPDPFSSGERAYGFLPVAVTVGPEDTISGYVVHFDGRVFANDQTTFTYTVRGTGAQPALSHFRVELPPCAPAPTAYDPTESVGINSDPATGVYGIEWHLRVEPNDSEGRTYSITFPGDVPLGVVRGVVKAGDVIGVSEIPGACSGYEISGTVFVDADSSGGRDPEESGISNVTVTLVDSDGHVQTALTDSLGGYAFIKLAGTYTVRIDYTTPDDDFNESLPQSFTATTSTSVFVTVGPDSPGNDFGFAPRTKKLINDLETGVLLTDGESARFWKMQLFSALSKPQRKSQYDAATLLQFIAEIQTLFLESPYQFTPGNELQEAYDILSTKPKTDLQEVIKQLLATEFNQVSGRGLIGAGDLQLVLIAWAEALVADAQSTDVSPGAIVGAAGTSGTLGDASTLLLLLNGGSSTGGGGGEE